MAKLTKKQKALAEKVVAQKLYPLQQALTLAKETATAKFDESIDVAVNLGVDARKSDQVVRGSVVLPRGTGKSVRVAVFAQGANAEAAKTAGAEVVGFEDLAEQIKGGFMDFDVVIASPDAMRIVGQLGQILGPRGLMPNPKVGTVTMNVGEAVTAEKKGKLDFRVDKAGIVHASVGKKSMGSAKLKENFMALLGAVLRAKPSTSKGVYIKTLSLSSTMGPGIKIDANEALGNKEE